MGACGAGLSVSVPASVPADNESNGMLFPMTPSSAPAPDGAAGIGVGIGIGERLTVPAGRWCCRVVGNFGIFPKNLPVSSMMGWIRKW